MFSIYVIYVCVIMYVRHDMYEYYVMYGCTYSCMYVRMYSFMYEIYVCVDVSDVCIYVVVIACMYVMYVNLCYGTFLALRMICFLV